MNVTLALVLALALFAFRRAVVKAVIALLAIALLVLLGTGAATLAMNLH